MSTNVELKSAQPTGRSVATNPATNSPNSRLLACLRCQQRKVKCDRKQPCSSCIKARAECTSVALLPPRRRKKRFPEAELLARLKRYEELLKSYGADIDAINSDGKAAASDAGRESNPGIESRMWADGKGQPTLVENNLWTGVKNEFRDIEEVLEGSSEDELIQAPITTTWETMGANNAAVLLFGSQHTNVNLTTLHPQPMDIMRLWQIFVDNVNPLIKVIHAPTIQQQILEISMALESVSKGMEALLFSIYLLAVTSIDDARCKDVFGEERSSLLARYQFGAQQALLNAEFLRPSSLVVLQALLIYLLSLRQGVDPRSVSCLSSITLRLGQQMGLHRDGNGQKLPPFEVEMRRRLWWLIVLFDSRVAEFSGVGTSVLTHQWITRLPSNVNDSDLYPNMREPPVDHIGATEMMFFLTRCEIAQFLRRVRATCTFDGCWHELSSSQIPLIAKDKAIDELEELLDRKYLKYCDASIPLHFISATMARSAICKLRHIARHPRLLPDRGAHLPQDEKDNFFSLSLKMIEYSNLLHSHQGTQKFTWHITANKPMDGYIHVLSELRYRTTGDLAERAWQQIMECFDHWVFLKNLDNMERHSVLFIALANLAVKAWEARGNALRQSQPFVSSPETILQMQAYLELWRSKKSGPESATDESFLTGSSDIGSGMSRDTNLQHHDYANPMVASDNVELSLLMSSLPMGDPMDWVYWNGLTHDYPLAGVDNDGSNTFSMV